MLTQWLASFRDPSMRAMIAMAFGSSDAPEVQQTLKSSWQQRVEQERAMFDHAIDRGEIAAHMDTNEIIERARIRIGR